LVDAAFHAIECFEGAGVLEAAERFLNGLLGFSALLARDEQGLLALRLFDFAVERAEGELELIDRLLLLLPLDAILLGEGFVLCFARQRFASEAVVARSHGHHRALLPLDAFGLL